ncbi:MAG: FAD-dependent oxidoreductase [Ignavibacteriales bacterium]|nr:FAD-dependent oxidoreductase [Ignavibacteriales bacterium]
MPALRHVQDRLSRERALRVGPRAAVSSLITLRAAWTSIGAWPKAGSRSRKRCWRAPTRARSAASATPSAISSPGCGRPRSCGRSRTTSRNTGARERQVVRPAEDEALRKLREIVGPEWASNDPAVLWTYADDPFPLAGPQMPRYVVLPGSRDEVAAVVRLANALGLPFAIRGNGGSVFGFVFTDGIVLDMNRMRQDRFRHSTTGAAAVEAGRDVVRAPAGGRPARPPRQRRRTGGHGLRQHRLHGHVLDLVQRLRHGRGQLRRHGVRRPRRPRLPAQRQAGPEPFRLRTSESCPRPASAPRPSSSSTPRRTTRRGSSCRSKASTRPSASPASWDRGGSAWPWPSSAPITSPGSCRPTRRLAGKLKTALPDALGVNYMVFAVADRYARDAIRNMAPAVIDSSLLRILMLGLPRLLEPRWLDLVREYAGSERPYELLCRPEMRPLVEAVLQPSPETIAEAVPEALRPFYRELYARPEMTDMVWLNMHRIVSARMSRRKHMFAFLVYVPPDRLDVLHEILDGFARVAGAHGIDHDFGFLTPMDLGKRAILEYDYYIDHTDPAERAKIARAMPELDPWLDALAARVPGVLSLKYVFSQGCSRKENFLYRV